jgi:hypothetical protein
VPGGRRRPVASSETRSVLLRVPLETAADERAGEVQEGDSGPRCWSGGQHVLVDGFEAEFVVAKAANRDRVQALRLTCLRV